MKFLSEMDGADKVKQDSQNRFVTDAEKTNWNKVDNKVDKKTGKGLSSNDYTTTEKNKLSGIEAGAEVNAVTSVAGKTGDITVNKSDVGLSNVDNTTDLNKPVSTATQTALNNKVDNSRVLTNVPLNAKFTDTNTTYSVMSTAEMNTGTNSSSRVLSAQRITHLKNTVITVSTIQPTSGWWFKEI
jgi:hypothetical protein